MGDEIVLKKSLFIQKIWPELVFQEIALRSGFQHRIYACTENEADIRIEVNVVGRRS